VLATTSPWLSFFPPRFSASVIVRNYYNSQAVFGVGFGYGPAGGVAWPAHSLGSSREKPGQSLDFLHIKSFYLSAGWFHGMTSINTFRLFVRCHLALVSGFSLSFLAFFIPLFYDTWPRK